MQFRGRYYFLSNFYPPLEAKRLGRRMPIVAREWNARRLEAMKRIVWAKFAQNPNLRIVEDNTWGDTY